MKKNYTSLKLSKLLHEAGCELESEYVWSDATWDLESGELSRDGAFRLRPNAVPEPEFSIPAYDILNDICVKYAKEFFLKETPYQGTGSLSRKFHILRILELLQKNKKKEVEDYIWEHCIFNPKNNDYS